MVNLLNEIESLERYIVYRHPNRGVGNAQVFEVFYKEGFGEHDGRPYGKEVLRFLFTAAWPIEIYDTGMRRGTKLSIARATKKIHSNSFRY